MLRQHWILIAFLGMMTVTYEVDYPKNKDIIKGEKYDKVRAIAIESKAELESYISNYEYVIAVFHMDWCGHCRHFLPVLDEASQYHLAKKFQFLKINCSHKDICDAFKADRFPTIKVYQKGNQLQVEPIRELEPLLEFIDKLSSSPIIEVSDREMFYKDYGTHSPLVIFNDKNTKFISCVNMLAKGDYANIFYFGQMKTNDDKESEKIIFDFNNQRLVLEWKDDCDAVREFLNYNLFPLIHHVDTTAIKKIQRSGKVAALLFVNPNEKKQMEFIEKEYTKVSYFHRNIVFGYVDVNNDKALVKHLNIDFKQNPQMILYDFSTHMYYIVPEELDMEKNSENYDRIKLLADDVKLLPFTTGRKYDDFLMKYFGITTESTYFPFLLIGLLITFMVLLILIVCLCDRNQSASSVPPEMLKKKQQ